MNNLQIQSQHNVNKREVDKPLTSQIWKEMRRFQYHRANSKLGCENASRESLVYNFGRCAAAPKVDHACASHGTGTFLVEASILVQRAT